MEKLHYKHYLEISPSTIRLGLFSAVFGGMLSLYYVLTNQPQLYLIFAVIGVFLISLIKTIGINEGYISQFHYSTALSITGGVMIFLGSYYGFSAVTTTIFLCFLVPPVALSANSTPQIATTILFSTDMFIIGSGLPAEFTVALGFALFFFAGGMILVIIFYLSYKIYPSALKINPNHESFKYTLIFRNYKSNLQFAVTLTLTVIIANIISYSFAIPEGFWIPMTALLLIKTNNEFSKERIRHRLYGTLIGSVVCFAILFFIQDRVILALLLFPTFGLIIIAFAKHYASYTFFLTIMITLLYSLFLRDRYMLTTQRVIDTIIGIIIVIILMVLLHNLIKIILKKYTAKQK